MCKYTDYYFIEKGDLCSFRSKTKICVLWTKRKSLSILDQNYILVRWLFLHFHNPLMEII